MYENREGKQTCGAVLMLATARAPEPEFVIFLISKSVAEK